MFNEYHQIMEDKNKNELEKDPKTFEELGFKRIVTPKDSDDDFNPPENSVGVDMAGLSAFLANKLMGKKPVDLTFEGMKEDADSKLSEYMEKQVNMLKILGEEASETDRQRLKIYWLDEKIQSVNNEIINTNSRAVRLRLEDLREYLEGLKGSQSPTKPNITFSKSDMILAYYYLGKVENYDTKEAAYSKLALEIGTTHANFKKEYNKYCKRHERLHHTNARRIEKILPILESDSEALRRAQDELNTAKNRK